MEIQKRDGMVRVSAPEQEGSKQGIPYFVGISGRNAGAEGICMNRIVIPAGGAATPHCHKGYETAIYQIKGRILTRYGERLENEIITEAGEFLYIAPDVWHQPVNLSDTEEAVAIVSRNDPDEQEHVVLYEGHVTEP